MSACKTEKSDGHLFIILLLAWPMFASTFLCLITFVAYKEKINFVLFIVNVMKLRWIPLQSFSSMVSNEWNSTPYVSFLLVSSPVFFSLSNVIKLSFRDHRARIVTLKEEGFSQRLIFVEIGCINSDVITVLGNSTNSVFYRGESKKRVSKDNVDDIWLHYQVLFFGWHENF